MADWDTKLSLSPLRKRRRLLLSESAASTFMNNVASDDLLAEIFLQLPDSKSAALCSTVCKRWSSIISDPQFIRSFLVHRRLRNQDFHRHSILLQARGFAGTAHLSFDEKIRISAIDLGGLTPMPLIVKASSDDLMLAVYCFKFWIINLTTKKAVEIPAPPQVPFERFALVRDPRRCADGSWRGYRVVMIRHLLGYHLDTDSYPYQFGAATFSFETGRWSESVVTSSTSLYKWNAINRVAACGGVLYWSNGPGWFGPLRGIVAFDAFGDTKQCRYINPPAELGTSWRSDRKNLCLGACRGRLRLSQAFRSRKGRFSLKVWELSEDDKSWSLAQKRSLVEGAIRQVKVLGFDRNDEDVLFLLCENRLVRRYNVSEDKQVDIGKFEHGHEIDIMDLCFFQPVYPPWPTSLPAKFPSV